MNYVADSTGANNAVLDASCYRAGGVVSIAEQKETARIAASRM